MKPEAHPLARFGNSSLSHVKLTCPLNPGAFIPIITEKRGRLPQLLPCARGDFTFLFCFCWGVYPGYCPFFAEFLRPEEFTIPGMAFTSISTVCFIFLVCARVLELDMK